MMRSRTTTTRETTAGRRGLLVGAMQWELLEGAGVRGLLDGAERQKVCWVIQLMEQVLLGS